ncbi:MAG: Rossman fold protein, TIGR00730 family [Elusimicrobia bacterium RIFOXYA12_FULL_51_18]|nr:MAG: Rossman fold protein, TIGR00730 family [Elusimicrobia bacterium RIFOXYA12_FULL_51_18]OGS30245.1 MAG: Rossman fold protein, TIGR00730 family [Elusimicrobia bacterium RIFOXYA2_FULL_53_38]
MRNICVFAGSGAGRRQEYASAAAGLGRLLAENGITLVYGGGRTGLMGAVADGALKAGGKVIGVIPTDLTGIELEHKGLTEMIVTGDMHSRKAKMHRLSDAFIALPGGIGTFDELFEALCWAQLGFHNKPCGLLNIKGYYDPLLKLVKNAADEGFVRKEDSERLLISAEPRELLTAILAYK